MIEAVVFDLDGVLLDTEELWDEARRQIAAERGIPALLIWLWFIGTLGYDFFRRRTSALIGSAASS